ncbi:MAG: PilT/PilU family type 4a pilus ATPase [Armatimonadota bacterium]
MSDDKINGQIPLGYYKIPDVKESKIPYNIEKLAKLLLDHRASDLHIKSGVPPALRVSGDIVPVGKDILDEDDVAALLVPCLNDMARKKLEISHEVDFAYEASGVRFRVNMFLSKGKLCAAFRHLSSRIPTIDELGLPQILKDVALKHNGLVLITGPAGSGKSTTLAAMIDHINSNKRAHIVTLEEPIEFLHKNKFGYVTQREVGDDTFTFFEGLKMALRQDPNVILIGEMRDSETIMAAILAAETGHLVLSTLHTPNTIQAIRRVVDALPENQQAQFRALLSNVLSCIISQRLINKVDTKERVAATEVLIPTSTVRSHIADGNLSEIYELMREGKHASMYTFTQSLVDLYDRGLISKEDALYHADQPTEFKMDVEGHQTGTTFNKEETLIDWM